MPRGQIGKVNTDHFLTTGILTKLDAFDLRMRTSTFLKIEFYDELEYRLSLERWKMKFREKKRATYNMKQVIPKSVDGRDVLGHIDVHVLDHFGVLRDAIFLNCPIDYHLKR